MPTDLPTIKKCLETQDNRITAHPMFIVQQKRKISSENSDEYEWVDDEWCEVDAKKSAALDRYYERFDRAPEGYTRHQIAIIWEFVTACFTEQGCKDYIACNGHNLHEPRIYVESAHRNAEWQFLRAHLMGIEFPE
jgi:hypothetical protein